VNVSLSMHELRNRLPEKSDFVIFLLVIELPHAQNDITFSDLSLSAYIKKASTLGTETRVII